MKFLIALVSRFALVAVTLGLIALFVSYPWAFLILAFTGLAILSAWDNR